MAVCLIALYPFVTCGKPLIWIFKGYANTIYDDVNAIIIISDIDNEMYILTIVSNFGSFLLLPFFLIHTHKTTKIGTLGVLEMALPVPE